MYVVTDEGQYLVIAFFKREETATLVSICTGNFPVSVCVF